MILTCLRNYLSQRREALSIIMDISNDLGVVQSAREALAAIAASSEKPTVEKIK